MQIKLRYFFVVIVMGFIGCDSNQVYDEYKTVSNQWDKNDIITFNVTAPDTITPYNLFVNLRNNNDYKFSNLFLIVEMDYPNGKVVKDTLEYEMTKADGTFLGAGFTDIKENKLWYKEAMVFKESGEYIVKVQHAMRENGNVNGVERLDGIIDVGFRIERKTDTK